MAIYRKIHVSFWSDPFVSDLKDKEKLFYLYLLTNERTRQCGIYEISKRQMFYDTGISQTEIDRILKLFIAKNKIFYSESTGEIAILNWVKYNDCSSPKVLACVNKELLTIKNKKLIDYLGHEHPVGSAFNKNYRVSATIREEVFQEYGNKCAKCGTTQKLQIDHIIPRAIGGKSIKENLRCLCASCNSSRPIMGEELIKEIEDSGYQYSILLEKNSLSDYRYGMRTQLQEEKEETKEEEQTKEKEEERMTAQIVSENSSSREKEKKRPPQVAARPPLVYPWPSERFEQAWAMWIKYKREEKKFTYKSTETEQIALKELAELANGKEETAIRIIQKSIASGWSGLFKISEERGKPITAESLRDSDELIRRMSGNG